MERLKQGALDWLETVRKKRKRADARRSRSRRPDSCSPDVASQVMLGVFGMIGYIAPVLLFMGIVFYASNKGNVRAVYKMLAVEILLIVFCGLAQLLFGGGYKEGQTLLDIYESAGKSGMGGGVIGDLGGFAAATYMPCFRPAYRGRNDRRVPGPSGLHDHFDRLYNRKVLRFRGPQGR